MKDLQVPCIVCGEYITWDDSPLPAACATHTYQEVFEAYDQAAQQSAQDGEGEEIRPMDMDDIRNPRYKKRTEG